MVRSRKLALSMHERASNLAEVAAAVRVRREELGLRQDELADLAGCATRTVSMLEHAKSTLRVDKLVDILTVLGFELILRPGKSRGRINVGSR
ncbi:MAG: helix-turn-helix domain-containing protein [Stackebrandtia sp.]